MVAVAEARVRLMPSRHTTGPLTRACRHTCRRAYPGVGSSRRQEKSHAPRGAAAGVNADARGSATIFASQASRDSQMTLEPVVESVRRPHAVHHNQRRRSSAGEGGALSSQSCNARSTRCLAAVSGKDVYCGTGSARVTPPFNKFTRFWQHASLSIRRVNVIIGALRATFTVHGTIMLRSRSLSANGARQQQKLRGWDLSAL